MFVCLNQKVQPPSAPSKAATADDTFTPSRTDSNAVFSQETEFYTALYTWHLRQQGVTGSPWGGGFQQQTYGGVQWVYTIVYPKSFRLDRWWAVGLILSASFDFGVVVLHSWTMLEGFSEKTGKQNRLHGKNQQPLRQCEMWDVWIGISLNIFELSVSWSLYTCTVLYQETVLGEGLKVDVDCHGRAGCNLTCQQ